MIGWEGTFLNLEWRTYQKTNSHRTLRDGSSRAPFLAVNCQASAPWKRTSQQLKGLHC